MSKKEVAQTTGTLSNNRLFTMREPGGKLTCYICDTHIGNCTTEKERLAKQLHEIEGFLQCRVKLTPRYTISDRTRHATKNHVVEIVSPHKGNAHRKATGH